jgi:rubredoxin
MDCYSCSVCGYLYEPGNGDPMRGVPANSGFGELPVGWVCPVCGASKDMFARFGSLGTDVVQGFFL